MEMGSGMRGTVVQNDQKTKKPCNCQALCSNQSSFFFRYSFGRRDSSCIRIRGTMPKFFQHQPLHGIVRPSDVFF